MQADPEGVHTMSIPISFRILRGPTAEREQQQPVWSTAMFEQQITFDSNQSFWAKLRKDAKRSGREVIEKGLWLYFAGMKPEVPVKARAIMLGALGYLIMPLDAVIDALGPVGYTDDLSVLMAALAVVGCYVDDDVKAKATAKLRDWFGDPE